MSTANKTEPSKSKSKKTSTVANFQSPSSDDIRQLSLAMIELANSLHSFVSYMRENPELPALPEAMRELSKRISVLSTRL